MDTFIAFVESIFNHIITLLILLIEVVGVCVLVWAVCRALVGLLRHEKRVRLNLGEGIALALEFKMGAEILHTLNVRELEELLVLGSIVLIRAAITFLIQWEIKLEKNSEKEELEAEEKAKKRLRWAILKKQVHEEHLHHLEEEAHSPSEKE